MKSLDDELGSIFELGTVVGVRGEGEGIDEVSRVFEPWFWVNLSFGFGCAERLSGV